MMSGEQAVQNYLAQKQAASGIQYAPQGNVVARVGAGLVNAVKDALPGLYVLPTALGDLKDIFIDKELPDPNWQVLPGTRKTMDWMDRTDSAVRGAVGLPRQSPVMAQNVTDTLLEELPSIFLMPQAAIAKAASRLPKAAQLATRVAGAVAGAPDTKLGKLAVGGLVGGANVAVINYLNSKGIPPERGGATAEPSVTSPSPSLAARAQAAEPLSRGQVAIDNYLAMKRPPTPSMRPARGNRAVAKYLGDKKVNDDAGFDVNDALLYGAAGLAGIGAYKALTKGRAALRALSSPSEEFGTTVAEASGLTKWGKVKKVASQLKTGMVEKDEPAISLLRKYGEDDAADYLEMSRPGGSAEARMRSFTGTGKTAGWDGELPRLADEMSKFKLRLSGDQRAVLSKAIRAGHMLTMHRKDPKGISLSDADLAAFRAEFEAADRDTGEVGQLFRNFRKLGQGMAKYKYDHGVIDRETYENWVSKDAFFMPTYEDDGTGRLRRTYDAVTRPGHFLGSGRGGPIKAKDIWADTKLRQPYTSMEEYMYDSMREVDNNIARSAVVRTLKKHEPDNIRVARKGDKDTFDVFEDGKRVSYYVKDPDLRYNLTFRPESLHVFMRATRYMNELFTKATTGAWNPPQAIASGVYDALTAIGTAPKGREFTPTVGGFDLGLIPGVGQSLGLAQGAAGSMALIRASLARTMSHTFRDYANMGGAWGVAPEFWEKISQKFGQVFAESSLNEMEQFGAVSSRFMHADNVVSNAKTVMKEMSPEHASIAPNMMRMYNVYHGIIDGIQNGARGYYWMKYRKKLPRDVDANQYLIKLAKDTRQLTGDFGKGGASQVSDTVRAMVPYWNTTIQSWRALGRAHNQSPLKFYAWLGSTMLTAGGAAFLMYNASAQHADYYRNKLSMMDRNRYWWIPRFSFTKDGMKLAPPEQSWAIPQPPEMQVANAIMSVFMDTMYDAKRTGDPMAERMWESLGETLQSPRLRAQLSTAWSQVSPLDVPLVVKQGMAVFGQEVPLGKYSAENVYRSPYEDGGVTPAVHNIMSQFFGIAGATLSNALDEGYARMKGKGLGEADVFAKGAWDSIVSDMAHRTPMVSSLFGHNRKRTGGTYESKAFQDKNAAIKRIQGTWQYIKDYATGTMGTGAGQMQRMSTKVPVENFSQKDIVAFQYIDKTMRKLQKQMQVINSNRDKIAEIDNNPRLSPNARQQAIKMRMDKIASVQHYLLGAYATHMEDVLTNIYGEPTTLEDLAGRATMYPPD